VKFKNTSRIRHGKRLQKRWPVLCSQRPYGSE